MSQFLRCFSARCVAISATDHTRLLTIQSYAPDRWAEDAPTLAGLATASVHGVAALGSCAGAPVRRWGDTIDVPEPPPLGRWHARQHGLDLHAGIVVPAGSRDRLERLCRYALPPQRAGKRAPGAPGCGRRWGRTGGN